MKKNLLKFDTNLTAKISRAGLDRHDIDGSTKS